LPTNVAGSKNEEFLFPVGISYRSHQVPGSTQRFFYPVKLFLRIPEGLKSAHHYYQILENANAAPGSQVSVIEERKRQKVSFLLTSGF
jgi:hypothetical protein